MGGAGSFEDEWPDLAGRLRATLNARGVGPWLRDDVVQETGLRLFNVWKKVDPARSPWGLTLKIANNLLWDHAHDKTRREVVGSIPEVQDDHDTERAALARLQLGRVRQALSHLKPSHRTVLLAEIGEAAALDGSRNRIKVLRLRARLALKGELGPFAPAGVAMRIRSLKAAIERRLATLTRDPDGVAASIASVFLAATLVFTGAGIDRTSPRTQESPPQALRLLGADDIGGSHFYRGIASLKKSPNLSEAKDRLKKHPFNFCLGPLGCNQHPEKSEPVLREAVKRTNKTIKQASRAHKKVWRKINEVLP